MNGNFPPHVINSAKLEIISSSQMYALADIVAALVLKDPSLEGISREDYLGLVERTIAKRQESGLIELEKINPGLAAHVSAALERKQPPQ